MNKRMLLLSLGSVGVVLGIAAATYSLDGKKNPFTLNAANDLTQNSLELVLDADRVNIDENGQFTMTTSNGNSIVFESSGLTNDNGVLTLAEGGYILNPCIVNGEELQNAISGMTKLHFERTGATKDVAVDYTWGESLTGNHPYYQRRNYVFPVANSYSFLDEMPNYLRIHANEEVQITSITINFNCNRTAEAGDNLTITTPSMLERLKTTVNWGNNYEGQVVELGADLSLASYANNNNGKGWTPIGTSTSPFKGTFEGNGHTISDLTMNSADYLGLFGATHDATLRDFNLNNVSITSSSQFVGGVVGRCTGGTIQNVEVSGTISAKQGAGGIAGRIDSATAGSEAATKELYISNCINRASITKNASSANALVGGIVGETNTTTLPTVIVGCENHGAITGNQATSANNGMAGGIVGLLRVLSTGGSFDIMHCSNFGAIASNKGSVGGIVGRARGGTIKDCYSLDGASISNDGTEATDLIGSTSNYCGQILGINEGSKATCSIYDLCNEDGVSVNAVSISTAQELLDARTTINAADSTGTYYKLTNDIDMEGVNYTTPIGVSNPFKGVFDGCGYTIQNLEVSASTQSGLFYNADGAIIKNINLSSISSVSTGNRASGLDGRCKGTVIYNCHVLSGSVTAETAETGGIVGVALDGALIRECSNEASVTGKTVNIGGIVGYAYSNNVTIDHCKNSGSVTSSYAYDVNGARVGGILGGTYTAATSLKLKISNSVNEGNVSSSNRCTGGIAGFLGTVPTDSSKAHTVINCVNKGTVTSSQTGDNAIGTGGIVGAMGKTPNGANTNSFVTVDGCYNAGAVASSGGSTGGIVGYVNSSNESSTQTVSNCINEGTVNGASIGTAGIVGATQTGSSYTFVLTNCLNYGDITCHQYSGGIVGLPRKTNQSTSSVSACYNYGNLTSTSTYVGGIVGATRINVDGCYTFANATLKNSSSTSKAYLLNATGAAAANLGYINATTEQNSTVSNCGLVYYDFDYVSKADPVAETLVAESLSLNSTSSYQIYKRDAAHTNGRIVKLNNGKYLVAAVAGYGICDTISAGAITSWKTRTNSYGQDYVYDPTNETETTTAMYSANFCPLVLPDGRVVIFYRTNTVYDETLGCHYSSIRAIVSSDNGGTWTKYRLFENYSVAKKGCYEPFGVVKDGKIYVYFASDITDTQANGLGEDNSEFLCITDSSGMIYQNIICFSISISGGTFVDNNDEFIAIAGTADYRRPGMPSIERLNDGTYAMAIEHCGSISSMINYWMQVAICYSRDLIHWTTPATIIKPTKQGNKQGASTEGYLCGAPVIQVLPTGQIAVCYTTNEYYQGLEASEYDDSPDSSWFRTGEMAISSAPVTYGSTPSMERIENATGRNYGLNEASSYSGCAFVDGKLYLISNHFTIQTVTTENEGSKTSRINIDGLYVTEYTFDYTYTSLY